ncbi:hypothetical protein ABT084_33830 [Streptomyces sp. NPDC002138]|uniref:hypothetical protein n=1 Tax=Streptomyces sp. NPDC002138 TaxID=3154410 RepID=UPI0033302D81
MNRVGVQGRHDQDVPRLPPEEFGATPARLADGRLDPGPLVTGEAGFAGLDAACASLSRPERHVKVLIRPELEGTEIKAPGLRRRSAD